MSSAFARRLDRLAERHKRLHKVQNLSTLHNSPVASDVTLHIGPERLRLYAHEDVLNASSIYFQLMLDKNSPFIEAKTRIVYKPTWNWDMAFALTRFMYTGELDVTADLLGPIYLAADEAQVLPLLAELRRQEKSFYRLLSDPWSAAAIYCFAELADLQRLSRFAQAYIQICGHDASNKCQGSSNEDQQYNSSSSSFHVCANPDCGWIYRLQEWPLRISTGVDGSRIVNSRNVVNSRKGGRRSSADERTECSSTLSSLPPANHFAFSVTVENVPADALMDVVDGRVDLGSNLSAVVFKDLSSFTGKISLNARKLIIKNSAEKADADGSSSSGIATVNRSAEEAVATLLDQLRRCNNSSYSVPLSSPVIKEAKPLQSDTVITGVFSKKSAFLSAQKFLHSMVKSMHFAREKDPNHDASVRPFEKQTISLRVIIGAAVAQTVKKSADRLRARTGCRFYQHQGLTMGYFLNGADPGSTITLEGRPFQILHGLGILESFLAPPEAAPSAARALYDSRGSLKITAPKLQVLRGLLETQLSFGYDLNANALYLIRPPEELKIILEQLSIFLSDFGPISPYPNSLGGNVKHNSTFQHSPSLQHPPSSPNSMNARSPSWDASRSTQNTAMNWSPSKSSDARNQPDANKNGTPNSKFILTPPITFNHPEPSYNPATWNRPNSRYNDPLPTPPNSPTRNVRGSSSFKSTQSRNETPPLQEEAEPVFAIPQREIVTIPLHVQRRIVNLTHPPHNHRV